MEILKITSESISLTVDCALPTMSGFISEHNGVTRQHASKDIHLALDPGENCIQVSMNVESKLKGLPVVEPASLTLCRDRITGKCVLKDLETAAHPKCVRSFSRNIDAATKQWEMDTFPFLFEPELDEFTRAGKLAVAICERQDRIANLTTLIPAFPLLSAWNGIAREGAGMRCRDKAVWFVHVLYVAGIQARLVSLFPNTRLLISSLGHYLTIPSHVTVEVYSRYHKKWMIVDPEYGISFTGHGHLLDAMEIHQRLEREKSLEIVYLTDRFKEHIPSVGKDNAQRTVSGSFDSLFSIVLYERNRSESFNYWRRIPFFGDYLDIFSPRYFTFSRRISGLLTDYKEMVRLLFIRPAWIVAAVSLVIFLFE